MKKAFFSFWILALAVFPTGFLRAQEPLYFTLQFHGDADFSSFMGCKP
jgi:hypothetical protein